ncbi:MAG: SAM-dependent methyltransferase [Campylobacterales bacterium]
MTPFSQYAREWLYGDGGYYAKAPVVGQRGDFVTSVSVSPYFGGTIANHLIRQIYAGHLSEETTVCEIGAHRGHLLADMVQFIYTLAPKLLKTLKFVIVEPLPLLREAQQHYFEAAFGDAVKLRQVASLADLRAREGFVVANELFDAFVFELINGDEMAYVRDHRILWQKAEPDVLQRAHALGIGRGELFLEYESFAEAIGRSFARCEVVTFDYGQPEYRGDFSARLYQGHKTWPLFEPASLEPFFQKADLTSDVPFAHLGAAFEAAGFTAHPVKTQNTALLELGLTELLDLLQQKAGFAAYRQEVGRVRALLDPAMLGERFRFARYEKRL